MSWMTKSLGVMLACGFAVCVSAQSGPLLEDARISINSGADADGSLIVRVTPSGGAPKEATVALKKAAKAAAERIAPEQAQAEAFKPKVEAAKAKVEALKAEYLKLKPKSL